MNVRPAKQFNSRNVKIGSVIAIVFMLFIAWMMYTASQTYVVESSSQPVSGINQATSEIPSTQMPVSMPGMNH